jgi:hypothetical protein
MKAKVTADGVADDFDGIPIASVRPGLIGCGTGRRREAILPGHAQLDGAQRPHTAEFRVRGPSPEPRAYRAGAHADSTLPLPRRREYHATGPSAATNGFDQDEGLHHRWPWPG